DAAIPTRVTTSLPPTIAASSSRPVAPCASPAASAAGQTTTLTWETESECVSSKSSPWQSIAFAKAAFAAGSPPSRPITEAWSSPPSSAIAVRPSAAIPSACAARPQPSVSRRWSLAAPTTSEGISSNSSEVVNSARPFAAVVISDAPVGVGAGERGRGLLRIPLVDHECTPELDHDLTPLVDAAAAHRDDADGGVRPRLAQLEDL